jgi:hypothetical protein
MSSKERVETALAHREPDAVPIDLGATAVTGLHVTAVAALRDYYGLERRPVKVHEPYQMLGYLDEDLKRAIGVDVEGVFARPTLFGFRNDGWKPFRLDAGLEVLVSEQFNTEKDERGDTLIFPEGDTSAPPSGRMPDGGYFFDTIIRQEPIDEARLDPTENLQEFLLLGEESLDEIEADVENAAKTGRAVIASAPGAGLGDIALVTAPFLRHPKGIRDVTEWYISIKTRPDYIREIFSRQVEIAVENLRRIHARIGDALDVIFICGTDFGTQSSAFCSVETFRELWFPYYKQMNDWIHGNTAWKTLKHSCGSVERFMSAFIECGFDILNPVQCSAAGMAPERLKKRYGKDLVFWGGGVDTQRTLPFGTPDQVREEVLGRCEIFAEGGGYVFNSVHNVQARTPVENIVAMIDAVHEFNGRG